jgi:3-oxoacyl-[acyl-carrier protein] reductase
VEVTAENRTAVVTGAARGIGLCIARKLIAEGWQVAGCDVSEEALATAAADLGKAFHPFVMNVADPESVSASVAEMIAGLQGIRCLVNNAGITRDNLLLRMDQAAWDAVLAVNLTGAMNVTRALLRTLLRASQPTIINITSVVGIMGAPGQTNYAASKAGLIGFTKALSREISGKGVRVNAIAPGFIETEMTAVLPQEVRNDYLRRIPMGSLGLPEDVADAVAFLAGPASKYITGVVLPVDGGLTT